MKSKSLRPDWTKEIIMDFKIETIEVSPNARTLTAQYTLMELPLNFPMPVKGVSKAKGLNGFAKLISVDVGHKFYGIYETRVQLRNGSIVPLSPYWEKVFAEHLKRCSELYEIWKEEISKEIDREIIRKIYDLTPKVD